MAREVKPDRSVLGAGMVGTFGDEAGKPVSGRGAIDVGGRLVGGCGGAVPGSGTDRRAQSLSVGPSGARVENGEPCGYLTGGVVDAGGGFEATGTFEGGAVFDGTALGGAVVAGGTNSAGLTSVASATGCGAVVFNTLRTTNQLPTTKATVTAPIPISVPG
jgi:hypothetical protein